MEIRFPYLPHLPSHPWSRRESNAAIGQSQPQPQPRSESRPGNAIVFGNWNFSTRKFVLFVIGWVYQNFWVCYICFGFFIALHTLPWETARNGENAYDLVFLMAGKSVWLCGLNCFPNQEVSRMCEPSLSPVFDHM